MIHRQVHQTAVNHFSSLLWKSIKFGEECLMFFQLLTVLLNLSVALFHLNFIDRNFINNDIKYYSFLINDYFINF
jgi:hypothetical protein